MLLGLSAPALVLVLVVMVLPVGWLFYLSFIGSDGTFSMENYARMLESKSYGRIFVTTFKVSLLTTAICIAIGYPLAYFLSQLAVAGGQHLHAGGAAAVLDVAAGAYLCLAGVCCNARA